MEFKINIDDKELLKQENVSVTVTASSWNSEPETIAVEKEEHELTIDERIVVDYIEQLDWNYPIYEVGIFCKDTATPSQVLNAYRRLSEHGEAHVLIELANRVLNGKG